MKITQDKPPILVLAISFAVVFSISARSMADEIKYMPPELLSGVRVGDTLDKVIAQQGWYKCGESRLCFDRITTLGETGRFAIDFINGKALTGEVVIPDVAAMSRMINRLPGWGTGNQTLVSIETKNTRIDVVKAVHDLGSKEAMSRFSRYLAMDNRSLLTGIMFVPRSPPLERQYSNANDYLNSLSADGVSLSLYTLGRPLNITVLSISPSLAAKKKVFPEFCDAKCEHWAAKLSENKPSLWERLIGFIK